MILEPMRFFVKIATVLMLVLLLGLHWALLQTVAWTGMIVSYSQGTSFQEAIRLTFDGKHPCCLCKAVKQGRSQEKQQEQNQVKPVNKLEAGIVWQPFQLFFRSERTSVSSSPQHAPARAEEPPKPRPKFPALA
jgi:hypothetical protein